MYLLDTDALSLSNPASNFRAPDAAAWRDWVERHQSAIYLSVVTLMEVRYGIEKSLAKGATRKAAALRRWLASAQTVHRARIVPVSVEIAHRAGMLLWRAQAAGWAPSSEDALVAATAVERSFTVVSRNVKHMAALSVACIDPLAPGLSHGE